MSNDVRYQQELIGIVQVYRVKIESDEESIYKWDYQIAVVSLPDGRTYAVIANYYERSRPEETLSESGDHDSLAMAIRYVANERWEEDEEERYHRSLYPLTEEEIDALDEAMALDAYLDEQERARPYAGPRPFPGAQRVKEVKE